MIPYADITEKADRRWTSRLLERLVAPDLPTDELGDLVGALQAVSPIPDVRHLIEVDNLHVQAAVSRFKA